MEIIGAIALVGLFLAVLAVDASAKGTRKELTRRLDRLEDKVDALLKHAGLEASKIPRQDEIVELARAGKKIEAIKIYRETTGASLAEAKSAVEQLA